MDADENKIFVQGVPDQYFLDVEESQMDEKGLVLQSQARELIARFILFMKFEAEIFAKTRKPIIPFANYKQRVLAATDISAAAYRSVMKEATQVEDWVVASFRTPREKFPDGS